MDFTDQQITAVNATPVGVDTPSCSGAYVLFYGTYAGITVVFEGTADGGATWVPVMGYQINGTVQSVPATTVVLGATTNVQYYLLVGLCQQVRVRCTAFTSGTLNVSVQAVTDADPIQPAVASGTTAVSNFPSAAAGADGAANPTTTTVFADDQWFNGTTWDRVRNNTTGITVDTSAAKTATANGVAGTNFNARGAWVFINTTVVSGTTPTLTVKLQGSVDGTNFFDLDATNAATASITAAGTAVIRVYPGLTNAVGTANQVLPRIWRCVFTIGGTTPSFTVATSVAYIL